MNAAVERIMAARFNPGATPRSLPYHEGLRAMLAHRLDGMPFAASPYPVGTPEADAYFAGQDEGRVLARIEQDGAT